MKVSFIVLSLFASFAAMASHIRSEFDRAVHKGADASIILSVVNDDGVAVSNANVRAFMGMNFKPKGYWVEGLTDARGHFSIRGKTCGDEINLFVSKEGYYDSRRKFCYSMMGEEHEVKDGKWMPYGGIELIRLREKRHPANLPKFAFVHRPVPVTNIWIGVDMKAGDFVKPHGSGVVSDFEVNVEWDGLPPPDSRHCMAYLRFPEKMSGAYYVNCIQESDYKYVYEAVKETSYPEKELKTVGRDSNGYVKRTDDVRLAVVRSRCVTDDDGKVRSACYGYIKVFYVDASWDGMPTLLLSGVFNPTPNDTNLEAK
ncbi:MAG: carboxypeptidase-like regulatory domain-containing protein [Kiritimatiellia bacterium]